MASTSITSVTEVEPLRKGTASKRVLKGTASKPLTNGTAEKPLPTYSPPKSGILSYVPASWVPYGELMRIDKPAGIHLFYFHHLFGCFFGSALLGTPPALADMLRINAILLVGTVFMRGSACAWNDTLDCEFDRQVLRCRLRPVARRALTEFQGYVFTTFLAVVAASCLFLLPQDCWLLAIPKIFLLGLYPFAKRFTDFPQLILGLEMSSGLFIGAAAVGYDFRSADRNTWISLWLFYTAQVCWTIIYDTVYAQQDVKDDAKAGVRSMAVRFQDYLRGFLTFNAGVQVLFLATAGWLQGWGVWYYSITCAGTAAFLLWNVYGVDLQNPAECMWWFVEGTKLVGGTISAGLALEAYMK